MIPSVLEPVLKAFRAKCYITRGNQKHVFTCEEPDKVCKVCLTETNEELGKIFRELMYRIRHPDICVVPRNIKIFSPPNSQCVIVAWNEERAINTGNGSTSLYRFIDETHSQLFRDGFKDLHSGNVGRFRDTDGANYSFKWFDL